MSSKIIYMCDCCGRELKNRTSDDVGLRFLIDYDYEDKLNDGCDKHLCIDCTKKIRNLINDIKKGRS